MTSEQKSSPAQPQSSTGDKVGVVGRIARLAFGLIFQLATFTALFFAVHLVRGSFETSVYSSGQRVVGGVLGFPSAALGLATLAAAIYTAATGRRGSLTFKLAAAAVGLFVLMYAIELAIK